MLDTIGNFLRQYPEMAIFICLTTGYWIGGFKVKGFGLGTVVGTLLIALCIGQFNIVISPFLKTIFFLLFMFATGYQVGPQFFSGLSKGGLRMVLVSVIFCATGLITVVTVARVFGFDKGFASGLLSGGLTQSSVIGTATDAISRLDLPDTTKTLLTSHVPIADAVTYLFGTIGATLFLAKVAPRLIRANLSAECEAMARELGAGDENPKNKNFDNYAAIDLQTYRLDRTRWAGHTVQELATILPPRVYIQRIHRGERAYYPPKKLELRAGDVVALSGPREQLIECAPLVGETIVDAEAMDVPFETISVVVNKRALHRRTLAEIIASSPQQAQGIHLRTIKRQGHEVPKLPNTRIERGDLLELVGRHDDLERIIPLIGVADRPTEKSDLIYMGITCMAGILLGAISVRMSGTLVSLGSSGGVLIAGLIFGWLHSLRPQYGRIPDSALWIMQTLGLNTFIAIVGITAAPHAIAAMSTNGPKLFIAGAIVTLIPHIVCVFAGRHLLKMNAGILLGACAGAGTVVSALQAVEDEAGSQVPVLGFTVPYALSNVLLTACGPLVVALVDKV